MKSDSNRFQVYRLDQGRIRFENYTEHDWEILLKGYVKHKTSTKGQCSVNFKIWVEGDRWRGEAVAVGKGQGTHYAYTGRGEGTFMIPAGTSRLAYFRDINFYPGKGDKSWNGMAAWLHYEIISRKPAKKGGES